MINLFERYTQASIDLENSLLQAGYNNQTIVLEDDGFLPSHVISPIGFFTEMNGVHTGYPKFFNEISVPNYWEIRGDGLKAEIFDGYKKKGNIIYSKREDDYRVIKHVEWLNENGNIRSIDMYNQHGKLFGRQTYSDGTLTLTSYFNNSMNEVISINHVANTVQVFYRNKKYYFKTFYDFIIFYFYLAQIPTTNIFYNSLGISYLTTIYLQKSSPETIFDHTLFWQENSETIPGNMKHLIENEEGPTKHIVVQNYDEYIKLQEMTQDLELKVDYLGLLYPFKRQVNPGKSIFILTNSDQVENLKELAEILPTYQIKVAALTEMSAKLMAHNEYPNVSLYPSATLPEIRDLISTSSFYFDINYGSEVANIIRLAFESNLLIMGFDQTIHNHHFVGENHIYGLEETSKIAQTLSHFNENIGTFFEAIGEQWKVAGQSTIDQYKEVLG